MSRVRGLIDREDGGVLVLTAAAMVVVFGFMTFTIDVGNWFVHKRHLQMQADAGALATGQEVANACRAASQDNTKITDRAQQYAGFSSPAGPTFNTQVAGRQSSVEVAINSRTWPGQPGRTDSSVDPRPPCESSMVDVKLTEKDLPFFFNIINGLVPGDVVPAINAHARISIKKLSERSGFLPIAVPQAAPKRIRATFINEATGASLGFTELTQTGTNPQGLGMWDNAGSPVRITMPGSEHVGVRIALGEGTAIACGEPLVTCFDAEGPDGLMHARAYSTAGTVNENSKPRLRSVELVPGADGCARPTFVHASSAGCQVGLRAFVDFGTTTPVETRTASVVATIGGTDRALTFDPASQSWGLAGSTVPATPGPVTVALKWEAKRGNADADACTDRNNNPCKGSFGSVQRVLVGDDDRSGPIQLAALDSATGENVNSFPQGSEQDLIVRIGIAKNLENAQSVGDPEVRLRVAGGSQTQSLDCDPDISNIRDEIRLGCSKIYEPNTSGTCPATPVDLWAGPQPWTCVAIQTGGAVGQVDQGLRDRILGPNATTCTKPSNWSKYPNIDPRDPRVVPLMLTPFDTFDGSGTTTVPVQSFATFYLTGWGGSPCPGDEDIPGGYISGHFIKYVVPYADETTVGDEKCNLRSLDPCYAQMSQ